MADPTYFAPAERASPEEIAAQVRLITDSPVTDGILRAADSLLAVLNEQRQVVSVNEHLLEWLGIEDASTLLDLRVGEALGCVHAHEAPAGCGTTPFCMSCGQAIATVSALDTGNVIERKCVIQANRDGAPSDLCLSVRACPISVAGERFIALLLRDISEEQRLAATERMVLHDLGNVINGLQFVPVARDAPLNRQKIEEWAATINRMLGGFARTFRLHRALVDARLDDYTPEYTEVVFAQLFRDVQIVATHHPAAQGKKLRIDAMTSAVVRTDQTAAARVLLNMLINAFEATETGGTVRVNAHAGDERVRISVWNAKSIPAPLALRIFQRNFTTHDEPGRGLGTVSMKMLGERMLGGDVHFTSNPEEGTTFVFNLPVRPPETA